MMLAALPRRQADDISGELFVAAYERQLGHMSRPQAEHMMDKALKTCRWFPTIAECLELAGDWCRCDVHTERLAKARAIATRERVRRENERLTRNPDGQVPFTQEAVDTMPEELKRLGVKCGALIVDADGNYIINKE